MKICDICGRICKDKGIISHKRWHNIPEYIFFQKKWVETMKNYLTPENHPMKNKTHTYEAREKIRKANLGKKRPEHSKFMKGKYFGKRKRINYYIYCACGCGTKTNLYNNWGRKRKFVYGHGQKGTNNAMFGKKVSIETKIKMSQSRKGRPSWKKGLKGIYSEETRKRWSKQRKGKPTWNKGLTKEIDERVRLSAEKLIGRPSKSKGKPNPKAREIINKLRSEGKLNFGVKPNKPEKFLINLIETNNIPFEYVGNGKIWFAGETQAFNPDFINKSSKSIIELFGDYWHNLPQNKIRDEERLKIYARNGYKVLIIWEKELKEVNSILGKIMGFIK